MPAGRPGNYPYPPAQFKDLEQVRRYQADLYRSLLDNDSRGEYFRDRKPPTDLTDLIVRPEWYGAKGDGTTDDTTAIQAAAVYASANGLPLVFSEGTYLITPTTGSYAVTIALTNGIVVIGAGMGRTIIKIKNSAGAWPILMGALTPTDLSGLNVSGITFDCNINNNHHAVSPAGANVGTNGEYVIWAGTGENIRIHDNEFKNCASVNVVYTGSSTSMSNVWIENNYFNDIGDSTTTFDFDSSIIYAHADHLTITGNTFNSSGVEYDGCRTAIETHGNRGQYVAGNIIHDFQKGMNITGVSTSDTNRVIVQGNSIYRCKVGIQLWPYVLGAHTSGYGLDNVVVDGNIIELGTVDDFGAATPIYGINLTLGGDSELDANNIIISNNIIKTTLDATGTGQSSETKAIGWRSTHTSTKTLSNSRITNNLIVNFPLSGIRFECNLTNVDISGNYLINCGSSLDTGTFAVTNVYRQPISIISKTVSQLSINRNKILDTNATTRCSYGMYLSQGADYTMSGISVIDNDIYASGTGFTNQFMMPNQSGVALPYLRGFFDTFLPTTLANQKYALGSTIVETSTGHLFIIAANQYTWTETNPIYEYVNQALLTTSSPTFAGLTLNNNLTVRRDGDPVSGEFYTYGDDATDYSRVTLYRARGALALPTDVAAGNYVGLFQAYGYKDSAFRNAGYAAFVVNSVTTNVVSGDFYIYLTEPAGGTPALKLLVNSNGNIGIGQATFGTSATKTIAQSSGTAPSTSPTDAYQQYSADIAAGNAAPHFRTENGSIVKLYKQVLAADLEEAYETPELDTEAEVITALNATNAKINDLIAALQNTGLLASS